MGVFFFWFTLFLIVVPTTFYRFLKNTLPGQFLHKYDNTWIALAGHLTVMLSIITCLITFYFYIYSPIATNHGQVIYVPDVVGKKIHELEPELENLKLNYVVFDTNWNGQKKPKTVLYQNPSPGSEVKEGRKIYLTINADKAPEIEITPDIYAQVNQGYRYDIIQNLKNLKFKVRTRYELSPYKDFVLRTEYRGRAIQVGDEIPQGSEVEVILGDGKDVLEEPEIIDSIANPSSDTLIYDIEEYAEDYPQFN